MRNFSFLIALLAAVEARADGFWVERLYPSAPGAGWMVMDDLNIHGTWGGAISLSSGYAYKPLQVGALSLVTHEAFADVGLAATFLRYRLYVNFQNPLATSGTSGDVGGVHFTAPAFGVGKIPDLVSDLRIGFDARLFGRASLAGAVFSPFRLGVSAQLYIPNGARSDYDSDGTLRAMLRALVAGDISGFSYAGQLGVHIRPLDEPNVPGAPRGSELLFGAAGGWRKSIGESYAIVVGPEIFGATAFNVFFDPAHTALEGLASIRYERRHSHAYPTGLVWRAKLAVGGGLVHNFGAPEFRVVAGIELFGEVISESDGGDTRPIPIRTSPTDLGR